MSLVVCVATELIVGVPGLGAGIFKAQYGGQLAQMYALIVSTGLIGLLIAIGFNRLERITLRWHPSQRIETADMSRKLYNLLLEVWLPVVLVALWWYLSENSSSPVLPAAARDPAGVQRHLDLRAFRHRRRAEPEALPRGLRDRGHPRRLDRRAARDDPARAARRLAPTIDFLRSIPAVALVSVFIVMLGFGDLAKVTAIAFAAFFPILLNTIDGVRGVDPMQLDLARAYKIRSHQRILKIILPAASPQIFAGLRISLAVALLVMAFSEMFAGTNGVGFFILFAQDTFRITEMWSGILLLGILGYLVNLVFVLVERRVMGWHRGWRATAREAGGARLVLELEVRQLSKTYGTGPSAVEAIDELTFSVDTGEFVCIVGPSGCGKTTLLKCLSGLLRPTTGVGIPRGTADRRDARPAGARLPGLQPLAAAVDDGARAT